MKLIFRTFFLTLFRLFVIMTILIALQNFDFSPLPEWTAIVVAYLAHFGVTWFFAAWAFWKQYPSTRDVVTVSVIFLVIGTALEAGLYFVLNPYGTLQGLLHNYQWQSLIIVAIYLAAILFAAFRARTKQTPSIVEGIAS